MDRIPERRASSSGLEALELLLDAWWPGAQEEFPQRFADKRRPELNASITPLDAELFAAGFRAEPPLMAARGDFLYSSLFPTKRDGTPRKFGIFEASKGGATWFRAETVAQVGFAFELIQQWRWPLALIELEPIAPGVPRLEGAVDVLIRTPEGSAWVCAEAKATGRMVARLIDGMDVCRGAQPDLHQPQDHKKCEALLFYRPRWFMGVACGPTRRLFRVSYVKDGFRLKEVDDYSPLRPPAAMELRVSSGSG